MELSYLNSKDVKSKYVQRIQAHYDADEIVKGQYWENGKGCAVGCIIHDSEHSRFETELGMPEWCARLIDGIFENLPNAEAKRFPLRFLQAVPVGRDEAWWNQVKWRLLKYICDENLERINGLKDIADELKSQVSETIKGCICLFDIALSSGVWNESAARSAESAAWSAAESAAWSAESAAESAARSAAWSTRSAAWSAARSAAWSAARSAESAAWSAAWSAARSAESAAWSAARSAAWSAARSAAYKRYADKLVELLETTDAKEARKRRS